MLAMRKRAAPRAARYSIAKILPLAALLTDLADGRAAGATVSRAAAPAPGSGDAGLAGQGAGSAYATRRVGGRGRALGFASMALPFRHLVPAPALCSGLGRVLGASVVVPSFHPAAGALPAPASGVRMMSGWKGGASSSRRRNGNSGDSKRSSPEGGWGPVEPDSRADGWGLDDAGDRRSWGRDAPRSRGGGGGRGQRGGGRGGGRFGGRGAGRTREGETREELFERQREYQAAQAERKSWMEEHALEFPGAEYLHGVSPVLAALRVGRRTTHRLFIQETMDLTKRKDAAAIHDIERMAIEGDCEVVRTDKGRLNVMSDNRPHQGLVLMCQPLEFEELKVMPPPPAAAAGDAPPVWLVLDEVMDPQNLGALVRSAYFLGSEGVIVCSKNSASLSPTVSKASAGAMELRPIYSAKNLMQFLEFSKELGWQVIGSALSPDSVPAGKLTIDKPTLLVMGNEGRGLRTNVLRLCDMLVQIEGGETGKLSSDLDGDDVLDSLNVSVAAGILLHKLLSCKA